MTRKATDVLLDIEENVKQILGYVKNNAMLISNVANRISNLEKRAVSVDVEGYPEDDSQGSPDQDYMPINNSTMPGLKPNVILNNGVLSTVSGRKNISKDMMPVKSNQHKNTPVQQKVQYQDGSPVANADVEISLNGDVIYKTKTNVTGKWTGGVKPGKYGISVYKKGTSRRPEVNIQSSILILEQTDPLQLDHLSTEI